MQKNLVLTLTGHDRIGIVEHVTKLLLDYDSNVESSRMARLGGEFAMLMFVSAPTDKFEKLLRGLKNLTDEGYHVTTRKTERNDPAKYAGWMPYQINVSGADHEGIVHNITRHLAEHGINIESIDTNMVKAPMSGTPLFMMTAIVVVPPNLSSHDWQDNLKVIGDDLNIDIEVSPYTG